MATNCNYRKHDGDCTRTEIHGCSWPIECYVTLHRRQCRERLEIKAALLFEQPCMHDNTDTQ